MRRAIRLVALAAAALFAAAALPAMAVEDAASNRVATGELGSCDAYNGAPAVKGDTAGMTFIPGGTFTMGSENHQLFGGGEAS